MTAVSLQLPVWPDGAEVAVCLTFDVDAESPWLARSPAYARRLSTLSEARYGIDRGLPRILDLLNRKQARGTFYVPGSTAELHPDTVRRIVEAGHEVGHHGHEHLRSHLIDAAGQRAEIERGLEALATSAGVVPEGYRSPGWEVTPETFALLVEHGFLFDASFMGDDRPYVERHDGRELVVLPVHWSLDDYPYFGWSVEQGGSLTSTSDWLEVWLGEFESALDEHRLVSYTMHPEVSGRGYRLRAVERLIDEMQSRANVWFPSHREVAALVRAESAPGVDS